MLPVVVWNVKSLQGLIAVARSNQPGGLATMPTMRQIRMPSKSAPLTRYVLGKADGSLRASE
jgi:hypothetical protein